MQPLVTCVLPTRNNRHLLPVAIASYLSQDYDNRELLVIDDGSDRVEDLFTVPTCTYFHLGTPAPTLSAKRNFAVLKAQGEMILHMDSDDWSAPTRVRHQVELLQGNPIAQMVGYHTAYFWDEVARQASCYRGDPARSWGPCLCYYRDFALANPWQDWIAFAEDNAFVDAARQRGQMLAVDGSGQIVVRLHDGNARRAYGCGDWPYIPKEQLPSEFLQLIE